jgi:hypothetical protein
MTTVELILKSSTIEVILNHRMSVVTNDQLTVALAYYLPFAERVLLSIYDDIDRSDVIAMIPSDKIVDRRHAISWQPIV